MISSQFISRIALQRDKIDSFETYPFSRPSQRRSDSTRRAAQRTFALKPGHRIQYFMNIFESPRDTNDRETVSSCVQKVFSMWQLKSRTLMQSPASARQ